MSMLTVTASPSLLPRAAAKPLAPTLGNAIAMIGAPKYEEVVRPSVSVATYASLPDLVRMMEKIDDRFDRRLGVAIELSPDVALDWRRLGRVANPGGSLAIVVPPQSRAGASTSTRDAHQAQIAGWDEVRTCDSIDAGLQRLLRCRDVRRCFVLSPEEGDAASVLQAIGRHLTA